MPTPLQHPGKPRECPGSCMLSPSQQGQHLAIAVAEGAATVPPLTGDTQPMSYIHTANRARKKARKKDY